MRQEAGDTGGPGGGHIAGGHVQRGCLGGAGQREGRRFTTVSGRGLSGGCCHPRGHDPCFDPHHGKRILHMAAVPSTVTYVTSMSLSDTVGRHYNLQFTKEERKIPRLKMSSRSHRWSASRPRPEPKTLDNWEMVILLAQ